MQLDRGLKPHFVRQNSKVALLLTTTRVGRLLRCTCSPFCLSETQIPAFSAFLHSLKTTFTTLYLSLSSYSSTIISMTTIAPTTYIYIYIVANMITYTISNIPCNLFVLICHLPFNLHCCLNDLQIRTPTAFPIHLPVYLTFHLHHLTVQHLLDYHWQCDYICRYASQCNELFSYTANMKTHMIVHSRGKAKQMQRVQKKFLRSGHLKTHLLIYSEEKPQQCGQREMLYRKAESLNKHILHHNGENPHSCTECKKVF